MFLSNHMKTCMQVKQIIFSFIKGYEGQSKITEPYLIRFELSKMEIYLDDISLKLYIIYFIT